MEAARLPGAPSRPESYRFALIASLLVLAAVAWAVTDLRMGGMDHGPGTDLGSFGFFVTVWVVMMAAMMFPSVAPTVVVFRRVQEGRAARGAESAPAGTAALLAGYLLAWGVAGAAAYGIFEAVSALDVDALAWDEAGQYVAAGVILLAAVYQLTPLKDVCLRHCRSPLAFLSQRWKDGVGGAVRMGAEHGAYCVGCCWMLMASLFALGVMSLGWMAFVAGLIALEKLLPWKRVANRGIAVVLLALGLAVALSPGSVPGLTIPDEHHGHGGTHSKEMRPREMAPGHMNGHRDGHMKMD